MENQDEWTKLSVGLPKMKAVTHCGSCCVRPKGGMWQNQWLRNTSWIVAKMERKFCGLEAGACSVTSTYCSWISHSCNKMLLFWLFKIEIPARGYVQENSTLRKNNLIFLFKHNILLNSDSHSSTNCKHDVSLQNTDYKRKVEII
jgi:hypothetical protein